MTVVRHTPDAPAAASAGQAAEGTAPAVGLGSAPRRSRAVAGVALLALTAAAGLFLGAAEVLRQGMFVPGFGPVLEVRLPTGATIFVDPAYRRLNSDLITSLALLEMAGVAGMALLILRALPGTRARRLRTFFAVCFAGAAWLAVDELLGLQHTLGYNVPALSDVPLLHQPDDVAVALYLIAAVVGAWRYRRLIRPSRPALALLAVAVIAGACAAALDLQVSRSGEESIELVAACCAAAGFTFLAVGQVRSVLIPAPPA